MKLQRSTIILVGLALVLGAGVLVSEAWRGQISQLESAQRSDESLFDFEETSVIALEVQRQGETLAFGRDESGVWQMLRPQETPAEEGAIAFLLSSLTTDAPQQQIVMTPDQQGEFGFLSPSGKVELTLEQGTTHTLVLGGEDFSGSGLYVLVDPEGVPLPVTVGETPIYVMTQDLANGVNRPLEEWLMASDEPESVPAPEANPSGTGAIEPGEDAAEPSSSSESASPEIETPEAETPSPAPPASDAPETGSSEAIAPPSASPEDSAANEGSQE